MNYYLDIKKVLYYVSTALLKETQGCQLSRTWRDSHTLAFYHALTQLTNLLTHLKKITCILTQLKKIENHCYF